MIAVGASRCKQKCLLLLTDFKTLQETKKCALMATVGETRDLSILRVEEITTRTDTCLVMYVSNPRVPVPPPPYPHFPGRLRGVMSRTSRLASFDRVVLSLFRPKLV